MVLSNNPRLVNHMPIENLGEMVSARVAEGASPLDAVKEALSVMGNFAAEFIAGRRAEFPDDPTFRN